MSARQCLKRLHLDLYRKDLRYISPATEAAFEAGHRVGAIARELYGTDAAAFISLAGGMAHALRKTARLLREGPQFPIFEATVRHGGVLVRIDLLLPDGDGWRIVEVKASTRVKDEYAFDCAVQSWVFQGAGHRLTGLFLAHVDNGFVYQGEGDYRGLLTEQDLSAEVEMLLPAVPEWIRKARLAAAPQEPLVAVGAQCVKPYECPFLGYCWPSDTEYPVQHLPRASKAKLGALIARGIADLRQVPADELTDKQLRVQRVSRAGAAERLPGAQRFADALAYPRYYLDFETIAPAIPIWAGTRPYEPLPIQWSCHFEASPGQLGHADFLDLTGDPPMRRLAESLIRVLGTTGPVLMYTSYERQVIGRLIERFPDLAVPLGAIIERLVDLATATEQNYYHPQMAGSWSLKAVLPCVAPDMNYSDLEGIQEGTGASEGYLEAIDPVTSDDRKQELRGQLLRYCKFDTAAMVRLLAFLGSASKEEQG